MNLKGDWLKNNGREWSAFPSWPEEDQVLIIAEAEWWRFIFSFSTFFFILDIFIIKVFFFFFKSVDEKLDFYWYMFSYCFSKF